MQATMTTRRETIQTAHTSGRIAARGTEATAPDRRRRPGSDVATADITEAWARRASHANGFGDAGY